jgi:hypothetical protein
MSYHESDGGDDVEEEEYSYVKEIIDKRQAVKIEDADMAIPNRYAEDKEETREVMFDPEDLESARPNDPALDEALLDGITSDPDVEVRPSDVMSRDGEFMTMDDLK